MASAALGMAMANSVLADDYDRCLHTKIVGLDLMHWINDGLMALFFLLVGLEIKRELIVGELDNWPRRALPFIAALGGMVVPALIFFAVNWHTPESWRGWAIPTATDIAFALGVLSLFGWRIPISLKVFLTSLAIIDDLGAILIIAIFYASDLSGLALGVAGAVTLALVMLNTLGVTRLAPFLLLGVLLWASMLFSGIHATLAGVVLAMTIPLGAPGGAVAVHRTRRFTSSKSSLAPGSHSLCCRYSASLMPGLAGGLELRNDARAALAWHRAGPVRR